MKTKGTPHGARGPSPAGSSEPPGASCLDGLPPVGAAGPTPAAPAAGRISRRISWEKYQALEEVNFSRLKNIAASPAHFKARWAEVQSDPTDAQRVGSAIHAAVFQPDVFLDEYVRWPGGRRAGKEWEAFVEEVGEREILRAEDHDLCLKVRDAVRHHPVVAPYLKKGHPEVVVRWQDATTMIKCKARLDWASPHLALLDLKSVRSTEPRTFGRAASPTGYGWVVQAAWYRHAWAQASGDVLPFRFVAVEKEPPYDVTVFSVEEHDLVAADTIWRGWLGHLALCYERNEWPGRGTTEQPLLLPEWAWGTDDLEDLDLEEGV